MGMVCSDKKVVLTGMVYEDNIVGLRDFLQENAPSVIEFDLSGCDDIHLGVLQLILAYIKMYEGNILYPEDPKVFAGVCEGFERRKEHWR